MTILWLLFTICAFGQSPQIGAGGVVGGGLSQPPLQAISAGAIVSIFGANFAPAGAAVTVSGSDLVNGALPTTLSGVCVTFGAPAPMLFVSAAQLNVQAPALGNAANASVQVTTGCGTAAAVSGNTVQVAAQPATPEFFYAAQVPGGPNPVAAIDVTSGASIGDPGLVPGANFVPAQPGDLITLFATGLGPVTPEVDPGQIPSVAAAATLGVTLQIGGVPVEAANLLYAGVTPGDAGIYQINAYIPATVPGGDQPVQLTVGGVNAPAAIIAINGPATTSDCGTPVVLAYSAFPSTLSAAGPSTLSWSVEGADTVTIPGAGSALATTGTAGVQAASTTVYTLTATSACGTSTSTVTVAVGPPVVQSMTALTGTGNGAQGEPGDVIDIKVTNVADPSTITQVFFNPTDGNQASVAPFTYNASSDNLSGDLYVRVPFIANASITPQYEQGAFQVTVGSGILVSKAAAFTVLPLKYAGNATADFTSLINTTISAVHQGIAQYGAQGYSDASAALLSFVAPYESDLTNLASAIASQGTATFAVDQPTAEYPQPATITATAADIANVMAYNYNLLQLPANLNEAPEIAVKRASITAQTTGGTCLKLTKPIIGVCQFVQAVNGSIDAIANDIGNMIDAQAIANARVLTGFPASTMISSKINSYLNVATVYCLVSPVWLQKFTIVPQPIPIAPAGPSTAIEAIANFTALTAPTASAILNYLEGKISGAALSRATGGNAALKDAIETNLSDFIKQTNQALADNINNLLGKLPSPPKATDSQQVGNCDLQNFYSYSEGAMHANNAPGRVVEIDAGMMQGKDNYYYRGIKGGTEPMRVVPFPQSFLVSKSLFNSAHPACQFYANGEMLCYTTLMTIGSKSLAVNTYSVNSCVNGAVNCAGGDSTGSAFLNDMVSSGLALNSVVTPDGLGIGQLQVQQIGDSTWTITLYDVGYSQIQGNIQSQDTSTSSVALSFQNTDLDNNTPSIQLDVVAQGVCLPPDTNFSFTATDTSGKSYTYAVSPKMGLDPSSGPVHLTYNVPGGYFGNLSIVGENTFPTGGTQFLGQDSCSVVATVTLSDSGS